MAVILYRAGSLAKGNKYSDPTECSKRMRAHGAERKKLLLEKLAFGRARISLHSMDEKEY